MRLALVTLCIIGLLCAGSAVPVAQDAPLRDVTVRLAGVSRGYARPLSATAHRVRALPGIEKAEAAGAEGDYLMLRVWSRLTNAEIAKVMGGVLLSESDDTIAVAAQVNMRARRAEARLVIARIADAIGALPKPDWRGMGESAPLFEPGDALEKKLEKLKIAPALVDGFYYKSKDYHIDENWSGNQGTYRVWAGEKWEGLPVFTDYWWGWFDGPQPQEETLEPDPASAFTGLQTLRNFWQSGVFWVDVDGVLLSSHLGERAALNEEGEKLLVTDSRDHILNIFSAATAYRLKHREAKAEDMPRGRGSEFQQLFEDDERMNRWDWSNQFFRLDWRAEEKKLIGRVRAYHRAHALYLDAELDVDAAAAAHKDTALEAKPALDISAHVKWIVAAEESSDVFDRRRRETIDRMAEIRLALINAAKKHPAGELCGRLSDPALLGRLGMEWPAGELGPEQYEIRLQMFGDMEILAGEPKNGGTRWLLFNLQSGEVVRSYQ